MKKFFRNIHLYLSLAAGLVVFVICLTGAILVFEKEWQSALYPERYYVTRQDKKVSLDESVAKFESAAKGTEVTGIKIYADETRTLEFTYVEKKAEHKKEHKDKTADQKSDIEKKKAETKKPEAGKGPGRLQAFVNPYTGDLISLYNHRNSFFYTVFSLHRWLMAGDIGKLITGISTSIFLFIIVTGIILWWPKTRAKLKQHLTIKWGGWKRINHDLHIVIGFYTSIFLFAFAFTGLAWSFEWFNNGIYWITGTENKRPEAPKSILGEDTVSISFDEAYTYIKTQAPDAIYYNINKAKEADATVSVTVLPGNPAHENASDQYFLDQYTGALAGTSLFADRNLGQKTRSYFYPIHVGSIGGITGRIIALLSCLAGVTFPVTGTIMWINRLNKKNKKKEKKAQKAALKSEGVTI
jgi:uncharacterized iron-regulated membrane protein